MGEDLLCNCANYMKCESINLNSKIDAYPCRFPDFKIQFSSDSLTELEIQFSSKLSFSNLGSLQFSSLIEIVQFTILYQ